MKHFVLLITLLTTSLTSFSSLKPIGEKPYGFECSIRGAKLYGIRDIQGLDTIHLTGKVNLMGMEVSVIASGLLIHEKSKDNARAHVALTVYDKGDKTKYASIYTSASEEELTTIYSGTITWEDFLGLKTQNISCKTTLKVDENAAEEIELALK